MTVPLRRSPVLPSPVFVAVLAVAGVGGALAWTAEDVTSVAARLGVFVLVLAGWIASVCLHEFGHAYTAFRAGDREVEPDRRVGTPRRRGRAGRRGSRKSRRAAAVDHCRNER